MTRPSPSQSAHHYTMAVQCKEQAIGIVSNPVAKTNVLLTGILHALLGLYTPEHIDGYTGSTPEGPTAPERR